MEVSSSWMAYTSWKNEGDRDNYLLFLPEGPAVPLQAINSMCMWARGMLVDTIRVTVNSQVSYEVQMFKTNDPDIAIPLHLHVKVNATRNQNIILRYPFSPLIPFIDEGYQPISLPMACST